MVKLILIFTFIVPFSVSCTDISTLSQEEYSIYRIALKWAGVEDVKKIVLVNKTVSFHSGWRRDSEDLYRAFEFLSGLDSYVGQRFKKANDNSIMIKHSGIGFDNVILVSSTTLEEIFETEPSLKWQNFRKSFSNAEGILEVSRISFSGDKKRAVFYWSFVCGPLCGSGTLLFLEHENKEWEVKASKMLWMS